MIEEDNKTLWCGNLADQVSEEILYELFLQAGPLERVRIARDRDGRQKNFAFITYCHEVSVPYAINLFRGTSLFHKALSLDVRGRIARLPPPIRCTGSEVPFDVNGQGNVAKQFAEMTDKLWKDNPKPVHMPIQRQDMDRKNDMLVMASLQGNWSHRHHPYRTRDNKSSNRNEYKGRIEHDNYKSRNTHSSWRDQRSRRNRRRD